MSDRKTNRLRVERGKKSHEKFRDPRSLKIRKIVRSSVRRVCYICGQKTLNRKKILEELQNAPKETWWELIARLTTFDHVIPLSKSGEDNVANIKAACIRCHYFKDHPEGNPEGWKRNAVSLLDQKVKVMLKSEGLLPKRNIKYLL